MNCRLLSSAIVAVALAGAGCGGDSPTDPTGSNDVACAMTLTGGQAASTSCTVATAWASSNDQGGVTITVSGSSPSISTTIGFPGPPTTKTYTQASTGAKAGISVTTGSSIWMASAGSGSAAGTYSLVLSSVSETGSASNGKSYTVHGTLDATLPALAGSSATGTVTMHVTF